MHRNEVAILERPQYLELLVGVLTSVLFHSGHERSRAVGEERVVMMEVAADVLGVGLANTAGAR